MSRKEEEKEEQTLVLSLSFPSVPLGSWTCFWCVLLTDDEAPPWKCSLPQVMYTYTGWGVCGIPSLNSVSFHENNFQNLFPNIENFLKCYKVVTGEGGKCHWQYFSNPFLFPSSITLSPKGQQLRLPGLPVVPLLWDRKPWPAPGMLRALQDLQHLSVWGRQQGTQGSRALMTTALPASHASHASRAPGLPASRAPGLLCFSGSRPPGLPGSMLTPFYSLPPPGLVWFWFFHPLPPLLLVSLAVFSLLTALALPKHPYRQHLGFCVRFRMTLGKEGGTSSGTCSPVTMVPGSWHESAALLGHL